MEIFEMMSFDFKEFVTSPAGILIIVGIICLIVGIIMFLKDGKKKKPVEEIKKEETVTEDKTVAPVVETTAPVEPSMVAPVLETPVVEAPVVETPVVVPSTNDGVNETPVPTLTESLNIEDSVETTPVIEKPTVDNVVTPEVISPVVEQPAVESLNVVEPVESLDVKSNAYGGVSPEVTIPPVVEEKPREIYGGANPLDNTAPIPPIQNVEAYSANTVQPVVEEPVVQEVMDVTPVAEVPQVAAPVIEKPVVETPPVTVPVIETPVVETPPVVEQTSSTPPTEELEKLEF